MSTPLLHNLLFQACTVVGLVVKHMSTTVFNGIAKGHGVGLFAKSEGLGIYLENYNLRDTPECKGKSLCVLCLMLPIHVYVDIFISEIYSS